VDTGEILKERRGEEIVKEDMILWREKKGKIFWFIQRE
jgi:hypothetical protein